MNELPSSIPVFTHMIYGVEFRFVLEYLVVQSLDGQ